MKGKAKAKTKATDYLVGTWFNADEYGGTVEFTIRRNAEGYSVHACDRDDQEEADIFETNWDRTTLTFATHWNSSGRFARYRILLLSPNRISLTYTYTENELFHRKPRARKG